MKYWHGLVTGAAVMAAIGALATTARADDRGTAKTLDVERINVRDRDGTLRLVIAGRDAFPGSFVKGREIARPDRRDIAGLLFINDEGTENGGLIWNGRKGRDGKVDAGASLTFDRYEQDQTLQLLQTDGGGDQHRAALIISDRPSEPLDFAGMANGRPDPKRDYGAQRMYVGRTRDAQSMVALNDEKGKPRLRMRVARGGEAVIEFLDADGRVARTLTPAGN